MPRKSRIDAPGALHHIIARGIERRAIFRGEGDRADFLERLGDNLEETRTSCFAWALLPNHFHLLLRTGATPISIIMRRVLTGYAVGYNQRHGRQGHLFQNRFKSVLCQEEPYLLELVRYIHLNPLHGGNRGGFEIIGAIPLLWPQPINGKVGNQLAGYEPHPRVVWGNDFRGSSSV